MFRNKIKIPTNTCFKTENSSLSYSGSIEVSFCFIRREVGQAIIANGADQ